MTGEDVRRLGVELGLDAVGVTRAEAYLDTERLIDNLEAMRNIDLGLGAPLNFGRTEHQASHKIWGTAMDDHGKYQPLALE